MEAKAIARYIRMSPRKVRLLADLIRGKSVASAFVQLSVALKVSRGPLTALLKSAEQNALRQKMAADKLYIKRITVDGGPVLKRSRARAFGRAAPIRKRMCHITIVLAERSAD